MFCGTAGQLPERDLPFWGSLSNMGKEGESRMEEGRVSTTGARYCVLHANHHAIWQTDTLSDCGRRKALVTCIAKQNDNLLNASRAAASQGFCIWIDNWQQCSMVFQVTGSWNFKYFNEHLSQHAAAAASWCRDSLTAVEEKLLLAGVTKQAWDTHEGRNMECVVWHKANIQIITSTCKSWPCYSACTRMKKCE